MRDENQQIATFWNNIAHDFDAIYTGPDEWLKNVESVKGSWWPEWTKWLAMRSGEKSEPPRMGPGPADEQALRDAPGDYVRQ